MSGDQVRAAALALSEDERLALAVELAESLEPDEDPVAVNAAWDAEIARRIADLDRGEVETVAAEDVFARARARLHGDERR